MYVMGPDIGQGDTIRRELFTYVLVHRSDQNTAITRGICKNLRWRVISCVWFRMRPRSR